MVGRCRGGCALSSFFNNRRLRELPRTGSFYVPGSIGVDAFEICEIRRTLAENGCLHVFRLNDHEAIQEWLGLEVRILMRLLPFPEA